MPFIVQAKILCPCYREESISFSQSWVYISLSLFPPFVSLVANRFLLVLLLRFSHSRLCEALNATIEAAFLLLYTPRLARPVSLQHTLLYIAPPWVCVAFASPAQKDKFVRAAGRKMGRKILARLVFCGLRPRWAPNPTTPAQCKHAG